VNVSVSNVGAVPSRNVTIDFEFCWESKSRKISGGEGQLALFPGARCTGSFQLSDDELPCVNGDFTVIVKVRYQGMSDKQYATQCAFAYSGVLDGFHLSAGSFS
jgi:hypothetical protein